MTQTLLLVEDSPGDAGLLVEALRETPTPHTVLHATDATEAWRHVERFLAGPPSAWPTVMVCDIGLPGMTGLELLEQMRCEAPKATWPIVMLTSSTSQPDVDRARKAAASAYFAKPVTMDGYLQLAKSLHDRFLAPGASLATPRPA